MSEMLRHAVESFSFLLPLLDPCDGPTFARWIARTYDPAEPRNKAVIDYLNGLGDRVTVIRHQHTVTVSLSFVF